MEKIGAGVIGVGVFGEIHARFYREHRLTNLLAVADINEKRAKQVAEKYGARAYTRYEDMLSDPEIQMVSVVVPDPLHRDPCVKAAEAGKHILLEKPLATTLEDGKAIIDACKKHRVKFMVDFMNRWNPPFSLAKETIESGEIGKVQYINIRLNDSIYVPTEMLSWAGSSTVLWFLGSHAVDLVLWLLDESVERVFCISRSKILAERGIHTPDFFHSVLEFKNGVIVNMENSWILPNSSPTLYEFTAEIVGSKGKIDIDPAQNGAIRKASEEKYSYPDILCIPSIAGRISGFSYTAMNHFVECVVDDKEPMVTKESSLEVTRVLLKLLESAKGEKFVKM
jgi:predicted dehydrogenase